MKIKKENLTNKDRVKTLDALYTAASVIHGREAMKLLLRDLLTESERIMLGRRILIAQRLINGEIWEEIAESMHVGLDTIGRVDRWLKDKFPGFENAIGEMNKEFQSRKEKKLYAKSALYRLKKKYPLYFLLFPTPK
ncbi:MAG TPA: Trp family transcriptional regulator [Candidatus Paceibacterota bacterium]